MSKKELARLAGVDRSTIRYVEDPDGNPTILTLIRVSLSLGIDLGGLISQCVEENTNRKNDGS